MALFVSIWTHMPHLPRLHQLKGCNSQYIRKLLFRLFSSKFGNNRCKRCNLAKGKLNVAKLPNLSLPRLKDFGTFQTAKDSGKVISSRAHYLLPSPTFETRFPCSLCQDKCSSKCWTANEKNNKSPAVWQCDACERATFPLPSLMQMAQEDKKEQKQKDSATFMNSISSTIYKRPLRQLLFGCRLLHFLTPP